MIRDLAPINYAGYGSRVHQEMMDAITGRILYGIPAVILDHELCIQTIDSIPAQVQDILGQARSAEELAAFRAFVAVPRRGGRINGRLWSASTEDMSWLGNYDIEGLWLSKRVVNLEIGRRREMALAHISDQKGLPTVAEFFGDQLVPDYLNGVERELEIAQACRMAA